MWSLAARRMRPLSVCDVRALARIGREIRLDLIVGISYNRIHRIESTYALHYSIT